jgi:hypothetical protein
MKKKREKPPEQSSFRRENFHHHHPPLASSPTPTRQGADEALLASALGVLEGEKRVYRGLKKVRLSLLSICAFSGSYLDLSQEERKKIERKNRPWVCVCWAAE